MERLRGQSTTRLSSPRGGSLAELQNPTAGICPQNYMDGTATTSMAPEPDPPEEDGKVLSPQELDLTDREGVEQIDEDRFVVSPDGTDPDVPTELTVDADEREASARAGSTEVADPEPGLDRTAIRDWHERQLTESPSAYGYHLSLKAGGNVQHHTLHSDDVTMAFNNVLLWYARTVDADLPPGVVLGILLSDASVPVQFPAKALEEFLMAKGLSTTDSIADLLAVVRDDGGVVFPPRTE